MIELEKAHAQLEELRLGAAAALLDTRLPITTGYREQSNVRLVPHRPTSRAAAIRQYSSTQSRVCRSFSRFNPSRRSSILHYPTGVIASVPSFDGHTWKLCCL
jgi:hypothetical protein